MPSDPNKLAALIVQMSTEEPKLKNPAAVAMGKLGGPKGGPARAKALSAERRREIARKAAMTRWAKKG